jgi:hypothetical protein
MALVSSKMKQVKASKVAKNRKNFDKFKANFLVKNFGFKTNLAKCRCLD